MKKDCKYCNGGFAKPENCSVLQWENRRKFCSRDCANKAMSIFRQCIDCGTERRSRTKWTFCSRTCRASWDRMNSGRVIDCLNCKIAFTRNGVKNKYCSLKCAKLFQRGSGHWNWRGGAKVLSSRIRKSAQYSDWRMAVLKRDNFTCQDCGIRGGRLHADHIKQFALYPDLRFEITNGRTLCVPCHVKTPTYSRKVGSLVVA